MTETFSAGEPVTHRSRKWGVVHSYFTRYIEDEPHKALIDDGESYGKCYETVYVSRLYHGHIDNPTFYGPAGDAK